MAQVPALAVNQILAIDVGATFIKSALIDTGELTVGDVFRQRTPYPCTPSILVDVLTKCINESGCETVGVGIPVALDLGRVVGPGSFSCPGGSSSPVDADLMNLWLGFSPQDALRESTHRDVRVVNDASLAALGCADGKGIELVLTLGTGLGLGLVIDGRLCLVPDVGWEPFRNGETFDELGGDSAMQRDRAAWNLSILTIVEHFATKYQAAVVHLAGGNARRVILNRPQNMEYRVALHDNDTALRGAVHLFKSQASRLGEIDET